MAKTKKSEVAVENVKENAAVSAENVEEKVGEATGEALYSQGEVQAMIAEAVRRALEEQRSAPQVVQVAADVEKVHFLWQAEVSEENVFEIGRDGIYGRIVGRTGSFYVPKNDLSRVMDAMIRLLLTRRWIVVVDGLDESEREAYGVNYKEGELLDKRAFAKMVELGDGMLSIYPKLCKGHQEMVAKRYHEAFAQRSPFVTREVVTELNRLSREAGSENGDFADIIEAMNSASLNDK